MMCRNLFSLASKNRGIATARWPQCQQTIAADNELPETDEVELIERKRNKSRLSPVHYKKLHKIVRVKYFQINTFSSVLKYHHI